MSRTQLRALALMAVAAIGTSAVATTPFAEKAVAAPSDVVLTENFDSGTMPAGFKPVTGDWSVTGGKLQVNGGSISRLTIDKHLTNYRLEAEVTFTKVANDGRWTGMMLDVPVTGQHPWWQAVMRTKSTAANGIEIANRTPANTWNVPYTASAPIDAGVGKPVQMAVEVTGGKAAWFFNGTKVATGRIQRTTDGVIGLVADGSTVTFDNLKLTELAPESAVSGENEPPVVIAHRGYSAVTPENTLAAMVAGDRAGARYVETDVQTAADGTQVIMHDGKVDRTTPGAGEVSRLAGQDVITLDAGSWFNQVFAAQKAPELGNFLEVVKAGSADLLLEVKGPETDAEVRALIDTLRKHGMVERTIMQSFDEKVLVAAKAYAPELRLGLLRGALDADPVATAKKFGVMSYNPSFGALKPRQNVVDELNAAGIAVYAWTADSANDWKWLTEAGVDGIITNRTGTLIGWQQAQEQIPAPPAPKAPTVTIASPANGSSVEFGERVVMAASTTDAAAVKVTVDGREVAQGSILEAADLGLGKHVVTVEVTGEGGKATATSTFTVVASAEGIRGRLAGLDVPTGVLQQMLTALDQDDTRRLERLVTKHVRDAKQRASLRAQVAALG